MKENSANACASAASQLQVLQMFRVIFGSVRQHFRQIERECGISGSQLWILQEVARTPNAGVSELAERLGVQQSTCSQLVEKLVAREYLNKERSKLDQRRVGLLATEKGLDLLAQAPGPAEGLLPKVLHELAAEDIAGLETYLAKVIAGLSLKDKASAHQPLADM